MAMVSLQSLYERARKALADGEHDKAEAICQHILQSYPQDLGTFQLLGQINLERKQARAARDYFRKVLEIDPENVSAHWGMGLAYQDEGKLEQAVSEFEQALEIKPDLSDLRTQLLRLYGELYGAPRAQLHLSRAGLGRLYVKGEMLDKAIEEFREVLKVDPKRADVQLSLIEALWQAGQVEEAAREAEAVLERLPNALKANLILGYVRMSAGKQAEAEEMWRRAAACDPNNVMARAIFESAPMRIPQGILAYDAAILPDMDEAAWEAQRAAAAAPPEEAAAVAPGIAVGAPAPAAAAGEPLGVSWLDSLATGEGAVREEEGELIPGLAPFSLEGLEEGAAGVEVEAPPSAPAAEMPLPEEIMPAVPEAVAPGAPFVEEVTAAAAEVPVEKVAGPPRPAEDQVMTPFSLADLGLTPEEIASLEEAVAATRREGAAAEAVPPEAAPWPAEEILPGVAPLAAEEVAAPAIGEEEGIPKGAPPAMEELVAPTPGEEELIPGVAPFTVEPFELEGIGAGESGLVPGEVKPFSLEELGLEETLGGPGEGEAEAEGAVEEEAELPAFSWQEPGLSRVPAFGGKLTQQEEVVPPGPTLFEKMMASRQVGPTPPQAPAGEEAVVSEEVAGIGVEPFSIEGLEAAEVAPAAEEEVSAVRPFSLEELGLEEPAAAPAVGLEATPVMPAAEVPGGEPLAVAAEEEGLKPFSLEELGLAEGPPAVAAEEEGLKPFSLEELGLEGGPAAVTAEEEGLPPFSLEELGLEEPGAAPGPAEAPAEAVVVAEEVLPPFSLEELGLTPEEIASLGLSPEQAAAGEAPAAPVEEAVAAAVEARPPEVPAPAVPAAGMAPSLEELRRQVEAQPADEGLRLSLARACAGQGAFDEATKLYRELVKKGADDLQDTLIADLRTWVEREQDRAHLYRLHRLLGDAYMRKGMYQQAMNEMAWVLSKQ